MCANVVVYGTLYVDKEKVPVVECVSLPNLNYISIQKL